MEFEFVGGEIRYMSNIKFAPKVLKAAMYSAHIILNIWCKKSVFGATFQKLQDVLCAILLKWPKKNVNTEPLV